MVEPEVITEQQVEQKVEPVKVFGSLEELQSFEQSRKQPEEIKETPEPEKKQEVQIQEPVVNKQPEFDAGSYLKGIFGDEYDTPDKVKAAMTKVADIPEDLKPLVEEAKFLRDNPQLLELAKYAGKEGADVPLFWQMTKLDIAKLEPKDALVLDYVFNQGLTKEEATALVESNHKVAFGSEEDYEAGEKSAAAAAVKLQAKEAKQRLVDLQQKVRIPEPERKAAELKQSAEQSEAQRKQAWKPVVKEIANNFSVNHKGEFGKDDMKTSVDFNFAPDEKGKEAYAEIVEGIISNPNFQLTKENREYVRQLADAIYFAQNRESIMNMALQKAIEERDAVWGKKVYGVQPEAGNQGPDNNRTEKVVVHKSNPDEGKFGRW